jgi:hypothetical protein
MTAGRQLDLAERLPDLSDPHNLPTAAGHGARDFDRRGVALRWRDDERKEGLRRDKNLPPDEPTPVLPKGTKTGLPKRRSVFVALDKIAKKSG